MLWIITAMQDEAKFIIDLYHLKEDKKYKNITFFKNDNIVLCLAWIGKVQASIGTTLLLSNYEIDKVINIWIAWNTNNKPANIWDVFIIKKVVQHDGFLPFDGAHLDYFKKPIELENMKIEKKFDFNVFYDSVCATWDQFIADKEKVEEIKNTYNADVVEMEAFAIASTCRELNLLNSLIIIKAVSDSANSKALTDHEDNLEKAMKNSIKVLDIIVTSEL